MSKGLKITLLVAGVLILGTAAFLFFLYKSHTSDAHLAAIPKNAAAVLKINVRDLALKADPKKLLLLPALKSKTGKNEKLIAPFLEDPFSTGIDPVENVYGFLTKEGDATIASLVFNVDDADKLSDFIKKLSIAGEQTELNGVHIAPIDEKHCIAWNSESGLMISSDQDGVTEIAVGFLNQAKDKSIEVSTNFESFSGKTFDIGLYTDNKRLSIMGGSNSSLSALGITDGHGEVILSFENEKITAAYNNYPETAAIPVLKGTGPDPKHFTAISSGDPLLYLGLAVDVKMLLTSLKLEPEMAQSLMGFQAFTGLTESEINTIFTGDISIAITDYKDISTYDPRVSEFIDKSIANLKMSEEDRELEREAAQLYAPIAYVSVDITDETRVNRILEESGMPKKDEVYYVPGIDLIIYAVAKNGHLLVTNDFFAAEALSKSGSLNGKLPAGPNLKSSFMTWADLDQSHYPKSLTEPSANGYPDAAIPSVLSAMKPFTSVRLEGSLTGSQLTVNMEKGEGNSLYRLIAYYASMN